MAVIQRHAKPQPRQTFLLPTNYNIHPSEHTSLLSQFLQLAPHLIRQGSYSAPTLRHPDLSLSNILLAPGTSKIISIIDWQGATILPRFMQAGIQRFVITTHLNLKAWRFHPSPMILIRWVSTNRDKSKPSFGLKRPTSTTQRRQVYTTRNT